MSFMERFRFLLGLLLKYHTALGYSLLSLLTAGGERLLASVVFQCPCSAAWNLPYSLVFLLAPAVILLLLSFLFSTRAKRLMTGCCARRGGKEKPGKEEPGEEEPREEKPRKEEPREEEPREEKPRKEEPRKEKPRKEEPREEKPRKEEPGEEPGEEKPGEEDPGEEEPGEEPGEEKPGEEDPGEEEARKACWNPGPCCSFTWTAFLAPAIWISVSFLGGGFYECAASGTTWMSWRMCPDQEVSCFQELPKAPCQEEKPEIFRKILRELKAESQVKTPHNFSCMTRK